MAEFPFIPLYGRDFRADTGHLMARETGAYLLLLMVAWELPQCRLPDDDLKLARWARVDRRIWLKIKPDIMAFWSLKAGHWTQTRLRKEWDNANKRASSARANGKRGGRPKINKTKKMGNPLGSAAETQNDPTEKLITSISTITNIDRSFLSSDKKNTPAQSARFVSEDALDRVRSIAPGWDRQALLSKFLEWDGSKTARNMDAAFLGWARKFTKGESAAGDHRTKPVRYEDASTRVFLQRAAKE